MRGAAPADTERVVFISHAGEVSGAERSIIEVAAGLKQPFEAVVLCPKPSELSRLAERSGLVTEGLPAIYVSRDWRKTGVVRLAWIVLRAWAAGILRGRSARPNVIHANSPRAALVGVPMAAMTRAKLIVHVRDIPPRSRLVDTYLRFVLRIADAVICDSHYVERGVTQVARPRRLFTIHNSVDLTRFSRDSEQLLDIRDGLKLQRNVYLVGLVAQITPWKGQLEAIKALEVARARGSKAHLVLIGAAKFLKAVGHFDNAAYEAELHRYVDEHRLEDCVHFFGETEELPAVMHSLNALLVPSWAEPFGRVVVEGMAAGIPVVATAVGGPAETIQDGINGLLRDPTDIEGWAEAIVTLEREEIDVGAIVSSAKQRATEFALERHIASVVDVYNTLICSSPRARR